MTFTVQEFHDLVRLLEQQPEWRGDLRRLLLTDDLLHLPGITQELAEAQQHTEERLEQLVEAQRRTEHRLEQLAEAQRRTEERLDQLAARMEQFAEAEQRTEAKMAKLAGTLEDLVKRTGKITDQVGRLEGYVLERRYRERSPSYFQSLLGGVHSLSPEEVATLVEEAEARGIISDANRIDLVATDLIVHGIRREDAVEVYLVVEISLGIGRHDVTRAARRAALLRGVTHKTVMPVVAGEWMTSDAEEAAAGAGVWCVLDGKATPPNAAGCLTPPS